MELQHIGAHNVKAGLRGSINDKEFQPVVMKVNRPQFITRLKQTCSEAMDKCGFKAGVGGLRDPEVDESVLAWRTNNTK